LQARELLGLGVVGKIANIRAELITRFKDLTPERHVI